MPSKLSIKKLKEKVSTLFTEKTDNKTTYKAKPIFITLILLLSITMGINSLFRQTKRKRTTAHSQTPLMPQKIEHQPLPEISNEAKILLTKRKIRTKRRRDKKNGIVNLSFGERQSD